MNTTTILLETAKNFTRSSSGEIQVFTENGNMKISQDIMKQYHEGNWAKSPFIDLFNFMFTHDLNKLLSLEEYYWELSVYRQKRFREIWAWLFEQDFNVYDAALKSSCKEENQMEVYYKTDWDGGMAD